MRFLRNWLLLALLIGSFCFLGVLYIYDFSLFEEKTFSDMDRFKVLLINGELSFNSSIEEIQSYDLDGIKTYSAKYNSEENITTVMVHGNKFEKMILKLQKIEGTNLEIVYSDVEDHLTFDTAIIILLFILASGSIPALIIAFLLSIYYVPKKRERKKPKKIEASSDDIF